jgi:hypothetical protein
MAMTEHAHLFKQCLARRLANVRGQVCAPRLHFEFQNVSRVNKALAVLLGLGFLLFIACRGWNFWDVPEKN